MTLYEFNMNRVTTLAIIATLTLVTRVDANSIPRSTNSRSIDPNRLKDGRSSSPNERKVSKGKDKSTSGHRGRESLLPPWNLSPKIDPDGFLTERFHRVHGEWEMDAGGPSSQEEFGRYFHMQEPVFVRQVPGDGNCLFHSITVALALVSNRTHVEMSFCDDREDDEPSTSSSAGPSPKGSEEVDDMNDSDDNTNQLTHNKKHHYRRKCRRINMNSHLDFRYKHDLYHLHHHSRHLRNKAVEMLSQNPRKLLFLQGNEYLRARDLVSAAAAQYNLSAEEYCEQMKKDSVWGGGPEIVGLCNYLKRPIHVYELSNCCDDDVEMEDEDIVDLTDGTGDDHEGDMTETPSQVLSSPVVRRGRKNHHSKSTTTLTPLPTSPQFRLRRMACFGSPKFDQREPLHILSADSRFPDVEPGKQLSSGNHFLALFPEDIIAAVMEEQEKRLREMERLKKRKAKVRGKSLRGGSTSSLVANIDDICSISKIGITRIGGNNKRSSTSPSSSHYEIDTDANLNINTDEDSLYQIQSSDSGAANEKITQDEFWYSRILPYIWRALFQIKSFFLYFEFNRP